MHNAKVLRGVPLFSGLDDDNLELLGSMATVRYAAAGEVVSHSGEPGGSLSVVVEGELVVTVGEDAVEVKRLGRGEFFGELGLLDEKPHSATVTATTRAVLLVFMRGAMSNFLAHNYGASLELMRVLAGRIRATDEILSKRVTRNAVREHEERLTFGQRLSDAVARVNGSWYFVIGIAAFIGLWFGWNVSMGDPFDPYPFVFLNLVLGIQVLVQGPLIVMAQNRQADKDRAKSDANYQLDLKDELNGEQVLRKLGEIERLVAIEPVRYNIVHVVNDMDPDRVAVTMRDSTRETPLRDPPA
jgi:CRP/FNR family transcriptional regulator, cyclic AMP receptor protein